MPPKTKTAALTPDELYLEKVQQAREEVDAFEETITQREWLLVCNKLERTRSELQRDGSLRLLALGWVKEKREHGGASWDRLLEMTDRELLTLHGYPQPDGEEPDDDEALQPQPEGDGD